MKLSKLAAGAIAMCTVFSLSTAVAMASTNSTPPQKQLVALGDSISYGYNLGPNNNQPSPYAFPYLMGQFTNEQVEDLAQPGATSTDLLNLLNTPAADTALQGASTVTIDIGSNDLLGLASKYNLLTSSTVSLTPQEEMAFEQAIEQFAVNLPQILEKVHDLAPSADIILYNLYDPIPAQSAPSLHALAEELIGQENSIIATVASYAHLPVADAYSLFNNNQEFLVLPGDVHPTIAGQETLAFAGDAVWVQEEMARNFAADITAG